jgi:hypothetical protein
MFDPKGGVEAWLMTPRPSCRRYIRFIYNRVILENSIVRAAAVSTLAKFACKFPSLRPSISVLLHRSIQVSSIATSSTIFPSIPHG